MSSAVELSVDEKTVLLSLVCNALDGRDYRTRILELSGDDCVRLHNVLKPLDDLLKAQWRLTGSPENMEIL